MRSNKSRIIFDIDTDVRKRFKMKAAENDIYMVEALTIALEDYINKE